MENTAKEIECKHGSVHQIRNIYLRLRGTKISVAFGFCEDCKQAVVAEHGICNGWRLLVIKNIEQAKPGKE